MNFFKWIKINEMVPLTCKWIKVFDQKKIQLLCWAVSQKWFLPFSFISFIGAIKAVHLPTGWMNRPPFEFGNFIYRVDSFEFIETVVGTISGTFHWNSREITWLSWGVNWTLEYANRGLNKVVIGWLIRWFSPISRHLGSTINVNFAVERSAVIRWVVVTLTGALHCKWMNGTTLLFIDGRWCMQIEPTFNWQDHQTN